MSLKFEVGTFTQKRPSFDHGVEHRVHRANGWQIMQTVVEHTL